ncbi:MAG: ABC transporter ATP-binding protein [Synergistaceae bacterium]|nr:ABC transporter ATP-binding protein [Synergistaceae bacterium]
MLRLIAKIYSRLKIYSAKIFISLILALIGTIASIVLPQLVKLITDEIASGISKPMNINQVLYYSGLAVIFLAGGSLLTFIQNIMLVHVSQLMGRDLRTEINAKLDRIPLSYFDTRQTGDIMSRITTDIDIMVNALTNNLSAIVTSIVVLICASCIMLYMNVILALVTVITSIIFLNINKFLMGRSQPYFIKQQMLLGKVNSLAEEAFNGHSVIKAFNNEDRIKALFEAGNDELYESSRLSQFVSGIMQPIMTAGGLIAQFLIVFVTSNLILSKSEGVTLGVMVAFMTYSNIFSQMLINISQFISFLQPAMASAERIFELLEEPEISEITSPEKENNNNKIMGDVKFSHVKFGYVPGQIIIHDFSADIKSGQKVAIVGPTGAGKSTMMNLLMRFYDLNDGKIYFDGVDISTISRERLHDFIGLVPQDIWTFEGSVKDNIIYSSKNISDQNLNDVLKASGLDYSVKALPEGVDTIINDISSLSSGQKQLITIARAMIKNSPVLILDEATSNVDTRTEKIIQSALDNLMKGRTSFVIAHRLSTIKNADLILVMNNGDVCEAGTHDELLAKNGLYADLYNSQFAQNF